MSSASSAVAAAPSSLRNLEGEGLAGGESAGGTESSAPQQHARTIRHGVYGRRLDPRTRGQRPRLGGVMPNSALPVAIANRSSAAMIASVTSAP